MAVSSGFSWDVCGEVVLVLLLLLGSGGVSGAAIGIRVPKCLTRPLP